MKKQEYRFYKETLWYLNRRFPFLHRTIQRCFVDPVPPDKELKFPRDVILREIDGGLYKLGIQLGAEPRIEYL